MHTAIGHWKHYWKRYATPRALGHQTYRCRTLCLMFLILACNSMAAIAANTPCSGSKGGIAKCAGDTFVCNDGSVSASKKSCQLQYGQASPPLSREGNTAESCSCRASAYCVGPRGGRYCLTDSGGKSYLRKN